MIPASIIRYLKAKPYASFELFFNNDEWCAHIDTEWDTHRGDTPEDAIADLDVKLSGKV
jgi:hypothetical protein